MMGRQARRRTGWGWGWGWKWSGHDVIAGRDDRHDD